MKTILLALSLGGAAVARAQDIVIGPDYEMFPGVEYLGGDVHRSGKFFGVLLLRDSTLSLHRCQYAKCVVQEGYIDHDKEPVLQIRLQAIRELSTSSQVRGPSVGSKLAWGAFAGDRSEEYLGIVYETDNNVEAPIFKTRKAMSTALDAKIRYRLKKMGVTLPPGESR